MVHGKCILMYAEPVRSVDAIHRFFCPVFRQIFVEFNYRITSPLFFFSSLSSSHGYLSDENGARL